MTNQMTLRECMNCRVFLEAIFVGYLKFVFACARARINCKRHWRRWHRRAVPEKLFLEHSPHPFAHIPFHAFRSFVIRPMSQTVQRCECLLSFLINGFKQCLILSQHFDSVLHSAVMHVKPCGFSQSFQCVQK